MEAGWQGDQWLGGAWVGGASHAIPLTGNYLNVRKTTIYGGSNEVQRNIVAQTVLG
jgi:alkylation response protein AidB-like acyl-CoA dehydrogenase